MALGSRYPRVPTTPNNDVQGYVYPAENRLMFDKHGSGWYRPDEADDYMRIARDDPGADPDTYESWSGPQQQVLFSSHSTGMPPETRSGDTRYDIAQYGNDWREDGFNSYGDSNEVAEVATQIAESRLPTSMLSGHQFDLVSEQKTGEAEGWYNTRKDEIGLTPDTYQMGDDSTVIHELGHAKHLRGRDPNPLSLDPSGRRRGTSVLPSPRENAIDHFEGVADGFADRYARRPSRGYGASSWADPLDQAMYDTTRHVVAATGRVPSRSLPSDALDRVGSLPSDTSSADRHRVAKRLMLHGLLEEHPGAEEALSVRTVDGGLAHGEQFRLAHQQHQAQQDPWVQESMFSELVSPKHVGQRTLMANPDAMDDVLDSFDEVDRAHTAHEQKFGTPARLRPHNMSRSQFGELGDMWTKSAMEQPAKMLPEGVIPTGKWAR